MNIPYKSEIGLESVSYFNFINAIGTASDSLTNLAPWLNAWEVWEIINYSNPSSTANVKFGDIIGFKNKNFGVYMSGSPNEVNITTQPHLDLAERWCLINPNNTSSTAEITTADAFVLQQVTTSKYANPQGGNIQSSIPLASGTASSTSHFRITQISVV